MSSKLQRLFVEAPLTPGGAIELTQAQSHYLANVLRLRAADAVLLFNGYQGEWRAKLEAVARKSVTVRLDEQTREQGPAPDLHYYFAPLKRARLDYMVQKATEMGASLLAPVITRHTVTERVNVERLQANAIEAAEQCRILSLPQVVPPRPLDAVLDTWDASRRLIFADEGAALASPIEALAGAGCKSFAVLIGPEGGFAEEERARLLAEPFVLPISLGPRIMRADTAAVACLALVNAVLGDWR